MGRDSNTVYVGSNKPVMSYVTACLQAIKNCGDTKIMARGRAISAAVDVAEVLRNRFIDAEITHIDIGTEELDGKRVSVIEIDMTPS